MREETTNRDKQAPSAWMPAVFVSGRQHSGNTLTVTMLKQAPQCFALTDEAAFFEQRKSIDLLTDRSAKINKLVECLRLVEDEAPQELLNHLQKWSENNPSAEALTVYREAMHYLAEREGATIWAQKATHYIFFADEILRDMPESKIVYMLRNPFDVAASRKRREPELERIVSWGISWNRGLNIATRLKEKYPDRIFFLRYEDLVDSEGETKLRELAAFAGIPFSPQISDVPLINPAESGYEARTSDDNRPRGLMSNRAYRYMEHLDECEVAAIELIVDKRLIERYYPGLPHRGQIHLSVTDRIRVGWLIISGPLRFLLQRIRWARKFGVSPVAYMKQRLLTR